MKLIIAGSRDLSVRSNFIQGILESIQHPNPLPLHDNLFMNVKEVVSGGAVGIDNCGEIFAKNNFLETKLTIFKADWKTHGKKAGPIRNREMAQYADALLLIWDGKSKGSANMKFEMEKLGKPVYEVIIKFKGTK